MKLSRRVYFLLVLAAISASVSIAVYASISQIFPAVTVPPVTFATKANCPTLSVSTATAGTATLVANCGSGTSSLAAFSVNRDGTSTPTFSISSTGMITPPSLGIAPDGSGCATTSIMPLTSGSAFTFNAAGAYNYCLTYTASPSGGTISQFTISWSA